MLRFPMHLITRSQSSLNLGGGAERQGQDAVCLAHGASSSPTGILPTGHRKRGWDTGDSISLDLLVPSPQGTSSPTSACRVSGPWKPGAGGVGSLQAGQAPWGPAGSISTWKGTVGGNECAREREGRRPEGPAERGDLW